MAGLRNITKELSAGGDAAGVEHRRAGRLRCLDVQCDLGTVINISASGLRVRCRHRPLLELEKAFAMDVSSTFGRFRVAAKAKWMVKRGWFKHEIGLEFVEIGPGGREILGEIARSTPSEAFSLSHSLSTDYLDKRAG
ncbi:MAG: PilZ domain-containing protein [Phycisphaerales bacterium]|nr:PilZ domain-containing protein [Phycisphaerales bacterium]